MACRRNRSRRTAGTFAQSIVDLLHEKFDPEAKQLITSFESENSQMFVDELVHFLESQPFVFAVFTHDDVRLAANAMTVFYQNGKLLPDTKGQFGPDVMADFVANYIQQHQGEPFFLDYPLVLPHDPWVKPPDYRGSGDFPDQLGPGAGRRGNPPAAGEREEGQRRFAAMVEYADTLVGRVTAQLDALKLSEKTLVIFTGDNGTFPALRSTIKGREMNGDKGRPTDAGTHVPLIAQWKGQIPAGKINQDLIDFTDFLPTLADVTGARRPAGVTVDGRSFAPQLRGQKGQPREWIFCHYDPRWGNFQFARYAHDKQFKLYQDGGLYDYRQDPLEATALPHASLTPAQQASRQKLQKVLDTLK